MHEMPCILYHILLLVADFHTHQSKCKLLSFQNQCIISEIGQQFVFYWIEPGWACRMACLIVL